MPEHSLIEKIAAYINAKFSDVKYAMHIEQLCSIMAQDIINNDTDSFSQIDLEPIKEVLRGYLLLSVRYSLVTYDELLEGQHIDMSLVGDINLKDQILNDQLSSVTE